MNRLFRVNIGPRENPRLSYCLEAPDATTAQLRAMPLAEEGERVSAQPVGRPDFPVMVEQQALECAVLRESPAAARARNFHRQNDAHALNLQIQMQGYIGGLPR